VRKHSGVRPSSVPRVRTAVDHEGTAVASAIAV
jgi:hypothetical protein